MEFKVEKKGTNKAVIEVEVEPEKFEEGLQKSYLKNAKYFKIPGFRPGKAPRSLIERAYGEEVFYDDAIDFVLNETYPKVIEESKLEVVSRPEVDIVQVGKGKSFIYKAEVYIKPEFELGEYKGVEIKKIEYPVAEEEVEHELEHLREENARFISVDREVQNGDIVTIDFEGFVDGESIENGSAQDYELTIGSGRFIPGFEEQLIGMKKGEEKEIEVVFPEDYQNQELAGKKATFKVKVKEIKVKELPELDDEFAKDVSEYETLEELKASIRNRIKEKNDKRAKDEMIDAILEKIAQATEIDIPEPMIENQINYYVEDVVRNLQYFGMTYEKYLEAIGKTDKEFREQFRERATKAIRNNLILEKIAKVENIQATDEELEKELERLAKMYNLEVEKLKERLSEDDIEYIKEGIILNKAIDFIYENAKIISEETQSENQPE
ncbi:trigger factor [Caldicellulosiruptor changbaiensis]|uniref:Trigger factor n=1 Tax=Caldicellulosiruptor changbaiensis TaxID=1222016 RepID=A0A3T0D7S5_9FIRM|nr:trigger factor [Caldicellulosiruptor changbaiensis]AZT91038.1 trigger factor [Caldicellulosiruptor changbaiensis]